MVVLIFLISYIQQIICSGYSGRLDGDNERCYLHTQIEDTDGTPDDIRFKSGGDYQFNYFGLTPDNYYSLEDIKNKILLDNTNSSMNLNTDENVNILDVIKLRNMVNNQKKLYFQPFMF